jgi:hypothetical protein
MNVTIGGLAALSCGALLLMPGSPAVGATPDPVYEQARQRFAGASSTAPYFGDAYGYALFPTVAQGAIGPSGARGDGRVFVDGERVGDVTLTQASATYEFSGRSYSQVIFFQSQKAFERFTGAGFAFDGDRKARTVTRDGESRTSSASGSDGEGTASSRAASDLDAWDNGFAIFTTGEDGGRYAADLHGQEFYYVPDS